MSDDLVKRLRWKAGAYAKEAANRIEQLEERLENEMQDLDAADRRAKRLQNRIEELEAKLAKAVEALVRIADTPSEMTWGVDSEVREAMNGMEIIAETTIAELTGGKDE